MTRPIRPTISPWLLCFTFWCRKLSSTELVCLYLANRGYYYASLFDAGKLRCVIYLINVLTPGEHLYSQLYHRVGSNTCSIQALDCFLVSKNHPTVNPTILLVSVLVLSSTNLISHSRMDVTASCRPFSAVYLSGLVLFSNFCSLVSLGRSVTCSFW